MQGSYMRLLMCACQYTTAVMGSQALQSEQANKPTRGPRALMLSCVKSRALSHGHPNKHEQHMFLLFVRCIHMGACGQ